MGRTDYTRCKDCGRHASEVGMMSHQRLCGDCARARKDAAALDLHRHSGQYFYRWRRGMAASVGVHLPDDHLDAA